MLEYNVGHCMHLSIMCKTHRFLLFFKRFLFQYDNTFMSLKRCIRNEDEIFRQPTLLFSSWWANTFIMFRSTPCYFVVNVVMYAHRNMQVRKHRPAHKGWFIKKKIVFCWLVVGTFSTAVMKLFQAKLLWEIWHPMSSKVPLVFDSCLVFFCYVTDCLKKFCQKSIFFRFVCCCLIC